MLQKRLKCLGVVLTCLLFGYSASGQFYVGIHGGRTLPQGFYADSRMSDNEWMFAEGHQFKAGAGRGWAVGIDMAFAIPALPDLEILLESEYMQGGVSRDVEDYYDIIYSRRYSRCSQYVMELPKFRNVPILLGVRYGYPLGGSFRLYGEAMAGVNFRYISDWTLAYSNDEWQQGDGQGFENYSNVDIRTYQNAATFAFRIGIGILVRDIKKFPMDISLGASYNVLGSSALVWDRTQTTRYSVYGDIVQRDTQTHVDFTDINPQMILIELGLRFNPFAGSRHVQDW